MTTTTAAWVFPPEHPYIIGGKGGSMKKVLSVHLHSDAQASASLSCGHQVAIPVEYFVTGLHAVDCLPCGAPPDHWMAL